MPIVIANPSIQLTWSQEIEADSPVFWAKLDETSGVAAADSGSAGLSGSYVNSPTLGESPLINAGTSVELNGTTQRVDFPVSANQFWDYTMTFEAWVNMSTLQQCAIFHVGDTSAGAGNIGYNFYITSTGALRFNTYDSGFFNATTTSNYITSTSTTYHVAYKVDAPGNVRFYVNGSFVEQVAFAHTVGLHGTHPIKLGAVKGGSYGNFLAGNIDEAVWFNTLLDDSRILAHYNAGV